MMDRNKADELPKMQCGFIDFVCSFVYKVKYSSLSIHSFIHNFAQFITLSFLLSYSFLSDGVSLRNAQTSTIYSPAGIWKISQGNHANVQWHDQQPRGVEGAG